MGLLTDPSAGHGKAIKLLLKYYPKLCLFFYVSGIVYFCLLASPQFNGSTYFSENALLPGLVQSEFVDGAAAQEFHKELLTEMEKHQDEIPASWLLAKFRQIGLDTYAHNFTVRYPFDKSRAFTGKNIYGIVRAPRAASTEALVLSVPFRPKTSMHATTSPSIAIVLAFAKFAVKEKYWAKDLILLVTEHEQLGMQAWLEAYHGVSCSTADVLDAGDMKGRAGAIQAAINLELHDIDISRIDVKIEGLNGQLPNLDLYNLANKMCVKEGLDVTFQGQHVEKVRTPFSDFNFSWRYLSLLPRKLRIFYKEWKYAFGTLMSMVSTQASGTPNGNHGLFYRFAIQALTLEGFAPASGKQPKASFYTIGRVLEGTFRSLNNLLERFHQSFFFYLLPAYHRYISIGLYIPALACLVATLFIKAYAKWCQLHEGYSNETATESRTIGGMGGKSSALRLVVDVKQRRSADWALAFRVECQRGSNEAQHGYGLMWIVYCISHGIGFAVLFLPNAAVALGAHFGYHIEHSILICLSATSLLTVILPAISKKPHQISMTFLNLVLCIQFGTALIWTAMFNISLAMCLGATYIPLMLLINSSACSYCSVVQKCLWLMAHPLLVSFYAVAIYTWISFPHDGVQENLQRAFSALQKALRFSIEDYMIYGNRLFAIAVCLLLPVWSCFWFVTFSPVPVNGHTIRDIKQD